MIKVNVLSEDNSWSRKLNEKEKFFNKVCKLFPDKFKFNNKKVFLTVLLSNNKRIKILNKKFRNKNKHTDILSFPFEQKTKNQKEIYLGDIIINLSKVKNKNDKNKFKEELNKLWIHGLIHLFCHKHKKNQDYFIMNKIEKKYLEYLN